ncbi:MAG: biotin/lipoyl-binding protein, partial [Burkholderiaceae bacterium]
MNFRLPTSRWARVSLVLVPLLVIWLIVRASSPTEVQATPVVSVFPSQTLSLLNASGYVVAQRKAAISTKASGRLEMLEVTEGSRVKKGQLLAELDVSTLRLQV